MKRYTAWLSFCFALYGCVVAGCGGDAPDGPPSPGTASGKLPPKIVDLASLPADAVVQSATLGLEQHSPGTGQTVDVYRITQSWTEGEPTWNDFAGSYDDAVSWASFASVGGSLTVDVSDLTSAWVAGSQPNYGLMLISSDPQAEDRYLSSDYSNMGMRPWLEVCYIAP